jgi:hypothetical protein
MTWKPLNDETHAGTGLDDSEIEHILGPLHDERSRMDRILSRLEVTGDLVERADLGSELVRSASRYFDTVERALFLPADKEGWAPDATLGPARRQIRETMTLIQERITGIDPRNVHASDGQGFENMLDEVVTELRKYLPVEGTVISGLIRSLHSEERQALAERIARTFRNASERPHPPKSAVGRLFNNARIKLDHVLEDVSTPTHPGAGVVDG